MSPMDHKAIKDLLPLAALDQLEPDEVRALQEHLRDGCEECEAELRALRETAAALALNLEESAATPAADFEERVWAQLQARMQQSTPSPSWSGTRARPPAPRSHLRSNVGAWRVAAAVFAAGVLVIATYAGQLSYRLQRANADRRREVAAINSRLSDLRVQLERAHDEVGALQRVLDERVRLERVLSAPDLRLTRLEPLAPAPGASALVAVSAVHNTAVLQASGLPATPAGKAYELWWITKEHGPIAAGLFAAAQGRPVITPVAMPPKDEHVLLGAVTLEPASGVRKPTGAMYLKGAPGPA